LQIIRNNSDKVRKRGGNWKKSEKNKKMRKKTKNAQKRAEITGGNLMDFWGFLLT